MPEARPLEERFIEKTKTLDNGCLFWTGYKNPDGYGMIRTGSHMELSHRVAYKLWVGEIPKGMYVCHTCDNPSCVNPNHLFTGTQKDNVADCVTKGRLNTQKGPASDEVVKAVMQIKEYYESGLNGNPTAVAKKFSTSTMVVACCLHGRYADKNYVVQIPIDSHQFVKRYSYFGVRDTKGRGKERNPYTVAIQGGGKVKTYGRFNCIHKAAERYNEVVLEHNLKLPLNTIWKDFKWKPKVFDE